MKRSVIASAPGKFHLIGEYSSVFGKPAILCAIDRRITVKVSISNEDKFFENNKTAQKAVKSIRSFIEQNYRVKKVKNTISVNSNLPIGKGLGSSAALCTSISAAFFAIHNLKIDPEKIYDAAFRGESVFHGNPSGGDLAASVYGGAIWFRKKTNNFKLHKDIKIKSGVLNSFLLIDSGKPIENTRRMVKKILNSYKTDKESTKKIIDILELLVEKMINSLAQNKEEQILKIIIKAENNLEKLGVVGQRALGMIAALQNENCSVKISGAGGIKNGSGMLLAYSKNKEDTIRNCNINNWDYINVNLEKKGVLIYG